MTVLSPTHADDNRPTETEREPATAPASSLVPISDLGLPDFVFVGRKRFTRADCDLLERMGGLPHRYELLDGEIIEKVGQNQPHAISVSRAFGWLIGVFGNDYVLSQTDMEVAAPDQPSNRPQPDVLVTSQPSFHYATAPTGSDVRVVWETSDSTLRDDMTLKADLYARAGVPEYVVQDVRGRRLIVHRDIQEGVYTSRQVLAETDTLTLVSAPDNPVTVAALLPPATLGQTA